MIINKKNLGDDWPFTVDEVEIWAVKGSFILVRKENDQYKTYAINGIAENKHISLWHSGIWANDPKLRAKKSLSPLFEYLEQMK